MKRNKRLFNLLLAAVFASSICAEPCNALALTIDVNKDVPLEVEVVHLKHEISDDGFVNSYMVDSKGNIVKNELMSDLAKTPNSLEFPKKFNLNEQNYITSVKSQGDTGTCWAHAAINSAESNIIMNELADTSIDLSEAHMVYFGQVCYSEDENDPLYHEGTNWGMDAYDYGGSYYYTQATLSKGVGLVSQAAGEDINNRPTFPENRRYESEWLLSNSNQYSSDDEASIKNHLMTKGALSVSYYSDDDLYSDTHNSYYQSEPIIENDDIKTNHAVSIVGWDDNFSKDNFVGTPKGDGAWICKNSWGSNFHDGGYFYLSYYNAAIENIYSVEVVKADVYDKIYQYDGDIYWGYNDSRFIFTGANMFTAEKNSTLGAVSFYTTEADIPYIISISKNDTAGEPMSGEVVYTKSGNMPFAGYHMIELDEDIPLNEDDIFTVSVCLNKAGAKLMGDQHLNAEGCSFINYGYGWTDMADMPTSFNISIKAFVSDVKVNVDIDEVNFPDSCFRQYVSENFDTSKDGKLTDDEVSQITSMNVSDMGIQDLTGIGYFYNLEALNCSDNHLSFLNLEENEKLTTLISDNNTNTVYNASCEKIEIKNVDISRISSVKGASIKETDGIAYFIPEKNTDEITYEYKSNSNFTTTFTLKVNNYIHSNVDENNKCTSCENDICAKISLDGENIAYYYDDLQDALDTTADYNTVYIYLSDDVEGNFAVNSGEVYLTGGNYTITSDNTEPALKVSSDTRLEVISGIINNTSTGKALYICENATSLLTGGEFSSIYTENESLTDVLPNGYAFYDSNNNFVDSDTQSINVPVAVCPTRYTITYELNGGINAEENPVSYDMESEDILLAEPSRNGYTFTGWTFEGQTEPQKEVVIPNGSTGNKTFTANWSLDNTIVREVSATLNGDIGLNYYIEIPESVAADEEAYVKFTINENATEILLSDITPENDIYKFTIWLTAKQMKDKVTFALYDSNDTLVDIYSISGNKVEGSTFDYTLEKYFNALSEQSDQELKALSAATLLYGSYAQKAFGYNADSSLDGSEFSDVTAEVLEENKIVKTNDLPEGLKLNEFTLILKTKTSLRLYFKAENINDYTFNLDNANVAPIEIAEENLYYIEIPDISAKDLDTKHTLIINENCILEFSALSYAYAAVKADIDVDLSNVVKALYKYNEAANAYFKK